MVTHTAEGAAGYISSGRDVPADPLRRYRAELSSDLLDEQGEVLDHLIGFAFDTLDVRVLDVRILPQPFSETIETYNPDSKLVEVRRFDVQYFERRRMEIHPELAGTPILLGLLGHEVLRTPEPSMSYPACLQHAPASLRPAIAELQLGAPIGCPAGAA